MSLNILTVATNYPEFLGDLYAGQPELADEPFDAQQRAIFATVFGTSDSYSTHLRALGCEVHDVICNADAAQHRWALDHGIKLSGNVHDRRRQIVAAQIQRHRPDVLYVFEWTALGDQFLHEMKAHVRLIAGQIASPLRPERTYEAYDLMISSWPPIVEYFRRHGKRAEHLKLAFDGRIPGRLDPAQPQYDVTFVGGFAPSHPNRTAWLERLLGEVDIDVFGYGLDRVPQRSPIRAHHRGPAWGLRMFEVLGRSRLTLNLHAVNDVRGTVAINVANNLRLYEATGMGTCLITDDKANLAELFEPGCEVVAFQTVEDCAEKIRYYLEHEDERMSIAKAGQERTLRDHTFEARMPELLDLLERRMRGTQIKGLFTSGSAPV